MRVLLFHLYLLSPYIDRPVVLPKQASCYFFIKSVGESIPERARQNRIAETQDR
jgi:hypothetical protein